MNDFFNVFSYTFKENVRKKSFIVSTMVILIIIVALMVVPAIISSNDKDNTGASGGASGQSEENKSILYVLDKSGSYSDKLDTIQKQFPEYKVKAAAEDGVESIKAAIEKDGKDYFVIIETQNNMPVLEYYTQQYLEGPSPSTLSKVFSDIYSSKLLKESNVSEDTISKVLGEMSIKVNTLGKSKIGGYITSIAIVIILFFAVYFYGYGVSMSVASEKTSRVMELLVTSVKPSRIILGKTAGMGLLGLIQLASIIIVSAVCYKLVFPEQFTIDGMPIEFSGFTPLAIILIIIYFILGYILYALMNAVVGATVSKAEDVNSAMMPMSFITIISFYLAYGTFAIPDSTMARVTSLIPFTSPFSIPSRLMSTEVPAWEIALSLFILVVAIGLIGSLSIKLYSFAVLHYGDRLKIGKLFQMSKSEKKHTA